MPIPMVMGIATTLRKFRRTWKIAIMPSRIPMPATSATSEAARSRPKPRAAASKATTNMAAAAVARGASRSTARIMSTKSTSGPAT